MTFFLRFVFFVLIIFLYVVSKKLTISEIRPFTVARFVKYVVGLIWKHF